MPSNVPLNTVRSFVSAASHLSFTQAATELHVTPGAVSRMVKKLEEYLEITLFHRTAHGLTLTKAGTQYLQEIASPLTAIIAATERLRRPSANKSLSVACHPTFAARWLLPRWSHFFQEYPEIEVQITTTLNDVDFSKDAETDIAIQLDDGIRDVIPEKAQKAEKVHSVHLLDIDIIPVCKPGLFPEELNEHQRVKWLSEAMLIHVSAIPDEWGKWIKAYQSHQLNPVVGELLGQIECDKGPVFGTLELALQAAIEGVGITVAFKEFVAEDLAAGRLINPFPFARHSRRSIHVQCPAYCKDSPAIRAYRKWLLQQAKDIKRTV